MFNIIDHKFQNLMKIRNVYDNKVCLTNLYITDKVLMK